MRNGYVAAAPLLSSSDQFKSEEKNLEQRRQRLLDRLAGADNGVRNKAAMLDELICLPGTRRAVLDEIISWIQDSHSGFLCWLNGVAGCGKSTIAATIHHHQKAMFGTTAIFYFTSTDQARCSRVVRSLAHWLARSSHGSLEREILRAIQNEPDIGNLLLSDQVQQLLATPLNALAPGAPPVVIVIDALDEWYDTRSVSALVTLLVQLRPTTHVKILFTSRDEKHIRDAFNKAEKANARELALDAVDLGSVEVDIEAYLKYHFAQLHESNGLDPDWPGPQRLKAIVQKSEHLFQFAATAVQYIRSGYPPAALNDILDGPKASGTLKDLYSTILRRVFADSPDISGNIILKHVLICLVCSPRPISLDTIAELWSGSMNIVAKRIYIQKAVLDHLGSFLIVPDRSEDPIRFLHTSFVEFLVDSDQSSYSAHLSSSPTNGPADPRFSVNRDEGNAYLAPICLDVMNRGLKENICHLPLSTTTIEEIDNPAASIEAGLRYAALHWCDHLIPLAPNDELLKALNTFATVHLLHWIEVLGFLESVLEVGHPSSRRTRDWCQVRNYDPQTNEALHELMRI